MATATESMPEVARHDGQARFIVVAVPIAPGLYDSRFLIIDTEGHARHLVERSEGCCWAESLSRPSAEKIAAALNACPPQDDDDEEPF